MTVTLEEKIESMKEELNDSAYDIIDELVARLSWANRKFAAVNVQTIADGFSKAEALAVTDLSKPFPSRDSEQHR